MKHWKKDGRDLMLNDTESKHWIDTGEFKRIESGDDADTEYCELRDRMRANGDGKFYEACCPPSLPNAKDVAAAESDSQPHQKACSPSPRSSC